MTAVPIYVQNGPECVIKKPTALEFNRDHLLFVADEVLHAIFQMNVESNGITITASILSQVNCPSQTYGITLMIRFTYHHRILLKAASYRLSTTEINNASSNPKILPSYF